MGGHAKIVEKIIRLLRLEHWLAKDQSTREMVEVLYRRQDVEEVFWNIWYQRIRMMLLLVGIGVMLFIFCMVQENSVEVVTQGTEIARESSGKTVTFGVEADTAEGKVEDELTVTLQDRDFNKDECQQIEKAVDEYVKKMFVGDNESLEKVTKPLGLVTHVPDTGVTIQWNREDKYVDAEGNILYDAIPDFGVEIVISAQATWHNWEKEYHFPVFIAPVQRSQREELLAQIQTSVESAVLEQSTEKVVKLPKTVGGYQIRYINLEEPKDFTVVLLAVVAMILMPLLWKRKQKEELQKRQEQLTLDYPELVNKIMLLLSAGLTVRGCFERIATEYSNRAERGEMHRYVYEEICYTCQEMSHGMTEAKAIEEFGKRCCQLSYLRLSSLLNQNIRKGSDGLIQMLETESLDAFEKRKETVKQMGEKAGTKLLLPMILMLGIVMAMIMVPAFMSM